MPRSSRKRDTPWTGSLEICDRRRATPTTTVDADQELFIDPNGGGDPDDSIQIQADINPSDGVIDDNGEDITIELDPLTRSITRYDAVADDTEEMTDGIFTDLQFTFLDSTRTVTADPAGGGVRAGPGDGRVSSVEQQPRRASPIDTFNGSPRANAVVTP